MGKFFKDPRCSYPDCKNHTVGSNDTCSIHHPEVLGRKIAGRTLGEWRELARRDACLDHIVPSDLRTILSNIT